MRRKQQNSGFSLIELIIALAVLAFLMLAVSSFMGSSVMQSKKARADVKMQTQSQEVYNLLTDSIMQANDILIVGYTASDDDDIDFAKPASSRPRRQPLPPCRSPHRWWAWPEKRSDPQRKHPGWERGRTYRSAYPSARG